MLSIPCSASSGKRIATSWPTVYEPGPIVPTDTSDELTVARYLDEMRHCCELPLSSVVKYCQRHSGTRPDFNAGDVLTYAALLSSEEPRRHLPQIRHRSWHWIAASTSAPNWIAFCPRTLGKMDKRSGNVFCITPPCASWRCWNGCAQRKADETIAQACSTFLARDRVWHAVLPFNDQFHVWLRQRRKRSGGGALWVHRDDDGTVHVYASADLSPRNRPNLGTWMSPLDALRTLIEPSLVLPGVADRRWLGTWKPPAADQAGSGGESTTFSLGNGPKKLFDEAVREAEKELQRRLGTNARYYTLSPSDIEAIWLPIVTEALDKAWDAFNRQGAGRA